MLSRHERFTQGKLRAVALMDAADRAALTPISVSKLHSLAYLADTLSPVWGLLPFDKVALKTERSPFFGQVQDALDALVVEGLIEVDKFAYEKPDKHSPVAFHARYVLRYESEHLNSVLDFLKKDDLYSSVSNYLNALAIAVSRLRDDDIAAATVRDSSWENPAVPMNDVIEISGTSGHGDDTPTKATLALFDTFKTQHVSLAPAARLRLYAAYLGQRLAAA